MTVSTERVAEDFFNPQANVAIPVAFPAYESADIKVYYGRAALKAAYGLDYEVKLDPPQFDTFTVTPKAGLIAKIAALIAADPTEQNRIVVRREMEFETDATPAGVRNVNFTSREFDRTALRDQELRDGVRRAVKLSKSFVGDTEAPTIDEFEPGHMLAVDDSGSKVITPVAIVDFKAVADLAPKVEEYVSQIKDAALLVRRTVTTFDGQSIYTHADDGSRLHLFDDGFVVNSERDLTPGVDYRSTPEGGLELLVPFDGDTLLSITSVPRVTNEDASVMTVEAMVRAEAAADQASIYNQGPILDSVMALASDTTLSYTAGEDKVQVLPGQIVKTRDGFAYRVVELGSSDYDWATAGGVLLYLLPSDAGHYNFAGMNPHATGLATGDDYPKLRRLLDRPGTGTGFYQSTPAIFFPNGRYFMSETIQLKKSVRLFGNASGQAWDATATLVFPVDTTGIIVHRYNTIGNGLEVPATTAGDASLIEGICLEGVVGSDKSAHGIWLRARAIVRNVRISNFSGAGFRPYAASNGSPSSMGNCNNWLLQDSRIQGCEHGVYAEGYDANAGNAINVDCSSNRRWGFWDASFLGNQFVGCHAASNGRDVVGGTSAYARYEGVVYHASPFVTEQQLAETVPGTNDNIWRVCTTTSYAIDWTPGNSGVFRHGGGYHSNNTNARATFVGCYNEGGQGLIWLSQHSLMVGGLVQETPVTNGAHFEGRFGYTWSRGGFRAVSNRPSDGASSTASLGSGRGATIAAFEWSNSIDPTVWSLAPEADGGWGIRRNNGNARIGFTASTDPTYPARQWFADGIVRGQGGTRRSFGAVNYSTAAGVVFPTSGTFVKGDMALVPNPNAGDYVGWVCTVSGTAGSTAVFKKFGSIEA